MIFKTHALNIPQIRAVVAQFGGCFFHGDGNIYATDNSGKSEESDFRKDFSNDSNEESRYRVRFQRGDKMPRSVEELNKMLLDSRNQEILAQRNIKQSSGVKTVTVMPDDYNDEDSEIDYSKYDRRQGNNQ